MTDNFVDAVIAAPHLHSGAGHKVSNTSQRITVAKLDSRATIPVRSTEGAAGLDLFANVDGDAVPVPAHGRVLIRTGIALKLPQNWLGFVTPRSGLALKHGVTVLNAPGLIDPDYRGDVGVILYNTSDVPFYVNHGDRIAQLVVQKFVDAQPSVVSLFELEKTERGADGFGSTGV